MGRDHCSGVESLGGGTVLGGGGGHCSGVGSIVRWGHMKWGGVTVQWGGVISGVGSLVG